VQLLISIHVLVALQVLGLEDNSISDWGEVLRLAGLPQLKRLQLSNNPISSITYPPQHHVPLVALWAAGAPACPFVDPFTPQEQQQQPLQQQQQQHQMQHQQQPQQQQEGPSPPGCHLAGKLGARSEEETAGHTEQGQQQNQQQSDQQQLSQQQSNQSPPFVHLEALLLGSCRLSSWKDVDQLNLFPQLRELRLTGNPLFAAGGAAAGAGRRFEVGASSQRQLKLLLCLSCPSSSGFFQPSSLGFMVHLSSHRGAWQHLPLLMVPLQPHKQQQLQAQPALPCPAMHCCCLLQLLLQWWQHTRY